LNSKRWEKLDELFQAALDRGADGRPAYVAEACAGDDELRQELESMLSHHEQANSFIEAPAFTMGAEIILQSDSEDLVGRTLGQYQIIRLLGTGGMGVVYLAFDQELHRHVALKFVHDELLGDQQRVQRFRQEARSASALNHPNILTIHQIAEVDGRQFIATEFVEGDTLRELIKRGRLTLNKAIGIAGQIASALSAAHSANIMHRDIKPENVMVRPDGYVKVLDFGLAKLTERLLVDSEGPTLINTEEGTIVGTIQYMSPEQTRGQAVDARTDIWSLGVVLYEMLTDHAPFSGDTRSDVIAAILEREPLPLTHYATNVPKEVQSLVNKSLKKDRGQRYQSAKDMFAELRALEQRLEGQINSESSASTKPFTAGAGRDAQPAVETVEIARTSRISSAQYLIGEIKEHKTRVAVALLTLVFAVTVIAVWYFKTSGRKSLALPRSMNMTRLETSDQVHTAAISPDGKSVAYVVREKACCFRQSLRLRQVETASDIQIDPPSNQYHQRLIFSPDGNYLYFTDGSDDLYRMPVLGGPKTRLIARVSSPLSFSPDGRRVTFLRRDYPTPDETTLMVANSDGTREEQIASRKKPDFFDGGPSWSPTQPAIACGAGGVDDRGRYMSVVEVRLDGGEQRQITSERWNNVGPLVWLSDGSGLLMLAEDQASIFSPQIWQLSYPDGSAHRITNELNSYENLSLSADSTMALTEQTAQTSNIWIESKPGQPREITSGAKGSYENPSWLSDNQLVYDSNNSGRWDIWRLDVEKGVRTQLTMNVGANGDASASADGRFIVFASNRAGPLNIWKMDSDGANPRQLTKGNNEDDNPRCTPDGKWVVYESTRSEKTSLWKVPLDGGEPIQLVDKPAQNAAISPDGKWVIYQSTDSPKGVSFTILPDGKRIANDSTGESTIWKISIDGGRPKEFINRYNVDPIISRRGNLIDPIISPDGKLIACRYQPDPDKNEWKAAIISLEGIPVQVFNIAAHPFWDHVGFRWSPEGKAITYRVHQLAPNDNDNLWSQPIDGGRPKRLTNFDSDQIFFFGWSKNGQLALSRGVETRDVILLTSFR
jgi:eukaryotic-like serine/threonine-protein kinase